MTPSLASHQQLFEEVEAALRLLTPSSPEADHHERLSFSMEAPSHDISRSANFSQGGEVQHSPAQLLATLLKDFRTSGRFPGMEEAQDALHTHLQRLEERLIFMTVARSASSDGHHSTSWLTWGGSLYTVLDRDTSAQDQAAHLAHLSETLATELAQLRLVCEVLSVAGRLAVGLSLGATASATLLPGLLTTLAFVWMKQVWRENQQN